MQHALDQLEQRVRRLAARAAAELAVSLPVPVVRADLRGLAAGRCHLSVHGDRARVVIRFHERVLQEEWLLRLALSETAPHEVAHAAIGVWSLGRRKRVRPHGPEWRALCRALGGSGRTTHSLPLRRVRRRREYEYRLDGDRVIWLGAVRHGRLQSGRARYFHRDCPVEPGHHTGRARWNS